MAAGPVDHVGDGVPAGPLGKRSTEILRIVGEAIVNGRRHADAGHIRVPDSFGIVAMRERAALLDGDLDITCEPGAGTRVRLSVPLERDRDAAEQAVRCCSWRTTPRCAKQSRRSSSASRASEVAGQAASLAEARALLRLAGRQRAQKHEHRQAIGCLTPREREVLQALAEGLDSHAIADRLQITTRTQRSHVANILTKLGVHSQLQAVLFALRYELAKPR